HRRKMGWALGELVSLPVAGAVSGHAPVWTGPASCVGAGRENTRRALAAGLLRLPRADRYSEDQRGKRAPRFAADQECGRDVWQTTVAALPDRRAVRVPAFGLA